MIEWDNDLPPFATLLTQAAKADAAAAQAHTVENDRALAG
jgi:hypothetical protein